jgi:hypothetical protein
MASGAITVTAFGSSFPGCICDVDVDRLAFMSIWLSSDIEIRSDCRRERSLIGVRASWPESIINAAVGMELHRVISHPMLLDPRIVVTAARSRENGTILLEVHDSLVAL